MEDDTLITIPLKLNGMMADISSTVYAFLSFRIHRDNIFLKMLHVKVFYFVIIILMTVTQINSDPQPFLIKLYTEDISNLFK